MSSEEETEEIKEKQKDDPTAFDPKKYVRPGLDIGIFLTN
jgi:hypothetical protein